MENSLRKKRVEEINEIYKNAKKLSDELTETGEDDTFTAIILTSATIYLRKAYKEAQHETSI
ncbi:hypothetical protein [Carnobacterium pleistocenium]|uniref:hypothetical protein n=1 Tax=Carnobacterium pleistocenium TaxID=181073 RepID=UPI000551F819|nr:hypothetical protein [Carnobacterium pleistocenium]